MLLNKNFWNYKENLIKFKLNDSGRFLTLFQDFIDYGNKKINWKKRKIQSTILFTHTFMLI